jgi:hypothetical protein
MIDWSRVFSLLKIAALEEYQSTGALDRRAAALFPEILTKKKYLVRADTLYYVRLTHPAVGELYKVGVTSRGVKSRFNFLLNDWVVEPIFEQAYEDVAHALQLEAFIKVLGEPYSLKNNEQLDKLLGSMQLGKTETFSCDVLAARPDDDTLDYWLQDNAAELLYEQLKQAGAPC